MTQQRAGDTVGGDRLRDMAETATDPPRSKGAPETAQQLAGKAAEQVGQYAEQAQDAARKVRPFVERSLKEQPMATLAAAAGIAFVLGALWRR